MKIYIASKDTLDLKNSWLWPGQRWRLQCPLNIVKPPFLARSLEIKRLEKLHINQLDLEWNGHYVNWCLYFIHNIFFNLTLMRRPFSRKSKDKFDIGSGTIQLLVVVVVVGNLVLALVHKWCNQSLPQNHFIIALLRSVWHKWFWNEHLE